MAFGSVLRCVTLDVLAAPASSALVSMGVKAIACLPGSLAHLQGLEQQPLGRVHRLDVVLVGARGGDHVHHLLDRVHVGVRHVALAIGQRVARVEHAPPRGLAFLNVGDAHAGIAWLAHGRGLEHHLTRLVGVPVGAGHGIHVGQVAGHHVQALRLRADGAGGNVEDGKHRHGGSSVTRLTGP